MNSFLKGFTHSILSALGLLLPTLISHNPTFDTTIGAVLMLGLNWLLSHTVATTTGRSAEQG